MVPSLQKDLVVKQIIFGFWPMIFCICFRVIAIAQVDSDPMKAWIELELQDGDAKIQAFFFNGSNQAQTLHYDLQVLQTGPNGTATNQQSGPFTAFPEETKVRSYFKLVFNIYDELDVILADSIVYGTNPNKTVKKQPLKEVIQTQKVVTQTPKKEKEVIKPSPTPKLPRPVPVSPNKPVVKNYADNLEIDGLIIDETRSKIGRDFYDMFYHRWIAPNAASNYSILIKELPSRGRGHSSDSSTLAKK